MISDENRLNQVLDLVDGLDSEIQFKQLIDF